MIFMLRVVILALDYNIPVQAPATHRKWEMSRDDCMDAGDTITWM